MKLAGRRSRQLLAVLVADAAKAVSTDRLIDAVWEDEQPASARTQVAIQVSRLRRAFANAGVGAEVIGSVDGGYRLDVGVVRVDALEAERALTDLRIEQPEDYEKAASTLRSALALWRGRPFEDVPLVTLGPAAHRIDELRLQIAEKLYDLELELGRYHEVVGQLNLLVDESPLRERFRAQLMTALWRSGRRADALTRYRDGRETIVEELGIEPGPELRLLQQEILAEPEGPEPVLSVLLSGRSRGSAAFGEEPTVDPSTRLRELERPTLQEQSRLDCSDPPLSSELTLCNGASTVPNVFAAPAELPPTVPSFTGRQDELVHLLDTTSSRLLALNGRGGVGKSTLALQAAVSLAPRHPDGQLYLNLRGATPGATPLTPLSALRRLLRSLGLPDREIPPEPDEAAIRFRSLTTGRRLLVLLDDALDESQVLPLLTPGPGSTTLITSRAVLGGLDGAEHVRVDGLEDAQAVVLLARLIGHDRVASEPDSATEIVRRCGQLPLAVRIAGARLASRPDWKLSNLAARLRDERDRLDELQHGDRAVRTSLAVGRQGIADHTERLLSLLGLLDLGDVGLPAAAALDGRSVTQVRRDLDRLVAAQLLEPGAGDERFSLQDLVRLHAREQAATLVPEPEQMEAIQRLVHFYIATMRNASRLYAPLSPWRVRTGFADDELRATGLEFGDREATIRWIRAESGNLVQVAHHAARLSGTDQSIIAYAAAMHVPVQSQGYWNERREVYELALAEPCRSTGFPLVQRDLGLVYRYLGLLDPAGAILEQAAQSFRERGDAYLEADTLVLLAEVDRKRPDHRAALAHLDSAHALSHDLADPRIEANVLITMGELMAMDGNYAKARSHFEQALDLYREIGSTTGTGRTLGNLGELCKRFGHLEEAVPFLEQAIVAHHEVGFSLREAERTWDLADVLHDLGHHDLSRERRYSAIDLATKLAAVSPEHATALDAEAKPFKPATLRSDP